VGPGLSGAGGDRLSGDTGPSKSTEGDVRENASLESGQRAAVPHLVVVGRGQQGRFQFLQEHLAEPGFVEVIWDRRALERRNAYEGCVLDRRCGERRQPLPVTWTALAFVVALRQGVALPRAQTA